MASIRITLASLEERLRNAADVRLDLPDDIRNLLREASVRYATLESNHRNTVAYASELRRLVEFFDGHGFDEEQWHAIGEAVWQWNHSTKSFDDIEAVLGSPMSSTNPARARAIEAVEKMRKT